MTGAGLRILVAGAGIAGLGAARALRQRGLAADVGDPVPVHMGVSPRGLSQQDDTVTVELDDGSAGRYDLVLGADGVHSHLRRLVVGADVVRPVRQLAWRFVTECPPEVTTWTVLLGGDRTFLAVPNRWSCGSVLLIGDAAHATSPNMAEGAAMALEDGLVLAECLAAGRGIARPLAEFQARRRPRMQWVLAQTHRRDRTRNQPPTLRNLVLRRWGRNIFHADYRPLLELP